MTVTRLRGVLAGAAILASTGAAQAQGPAPLDRGYLHANIGLQATSHDLTQSGAVPVYDEPAPFTAAGEVDGGALFEIGGGYRVWGDVFAGVSYTRMSKDADAVLTASAPHPVFFDQFRSVNGTVPGLDHAEQALHLQAVWRKPVTTDIDVAVSAGPTIFFVKQDLVSGLSVAETGSGGAVLTDITVGEASEKGVGFHIGVDGTYLITRQWGAGAFVRYAGGSVDLESDAGTTSLDVGGFQIGAGIRYRF